MATALPVEWSPDEVEKLIHLVQKYRCLYDTSCSDYKDAVKRGNANEEIATKMGRGMCNHCCPFV